jgi:hypothetical protein
MRRAGFVRAKRRTSARSLRRGRFLMDRHLLRGSEDECADQERGAGRRTIRPQVPSPRSSLPDPLTSPLIPFPHRFAPMCRKDADSALTTVDAGLPQLTPVDRFPKCAERTQSRRRKNDLRPRRKNAPRPRFIILKRDGARYYDGGHATSCDVAQRELQMCGTNPIPKYPAHRAVATRVTSHIRAKTNRSPATRAYADKGLSDALQAP